MGHQEHLEKPYNDYAEMCDGLEKGLDEIHESLESCGYTFMGTIESNNNGFDVFSKEKVSEDVFNAVVINHEDNSTQAVDLYHLFGDLYAITREDNSVTTYELFEGEFHYVGGQKESDNNKFVIDEKIRLIRKSNFKTKIIKD